jgi:hypothetical protein
MKINAPRRVRAYICKISPSLPKGAGRHYDIVGGDDIVRIIPV